MDGVSRRQLVVGGVAASCLAASGVACCLRRKKDPTLDITETYTDAERRFTIRYASGWIVESQHEHATETFTFFDPRNPGQKVVLVIEAIPMDLNLKVYAKNAKLSTISELSRLGEVSEVTTKAVKLPRHFTQYLLSLKVDDVSECYLWNAMCISEGYGWGIQISCETEEFDKVVRYAQKMAETLGFCTSLFDRMTLGLLQGL
ncbi:hypothetical protein DIPPA_35427 [Diplonema papillatum]|nr:hypothetical protein DIPPA_35427 [Diplonema papillatum]